MNEKSIIKTLSKAVVCYKNAAIDTIKHDGIEHAGYISFLCMLSIFPFFIFFSAVLSSNQYLHDALKETIFSITNYLLDSKSNFAVLIAPLQPRLEEIIYTPPQSFLGLAIFSIIWSASSLLEGLSTILNRAYRVSKVQPYMLRRLMSIFRFILIIFVVVMIAIAIKLIPLLLELITNSIKIFEKNIIALTFVIKLFDQFSFFNKYINSSISIGITFLFLSYLYYLIPNKKQKFMHTFPGTFNTIIWWWLSTNALQYYIMVFPQVNLVYGSIAGMIITLLYFHMCGIVFIYGAELNYWFSVIFFYSRANNKFDKLLND